MKLLHRAGKYFDSFIWILAIVSAFIIITITLLTDYEVLMRYGFHSGQSWVTELTDNLLIFMTFFGVAWLLKEDGHVSIDILYTALSPKKQRIIDLIIDILCLVACIIMMWYSTELSIDDILNGVREAKTMKAPRGIIIAAIPFGFLTLAIQFARRFYGHLTSLKPQRVK
jgi:TRAP-type C4-dicarboxylate transport system permease small subunit